VNLLKIRRSDAERGGFSLVEMLMVVAVIVILIAISLSIGNVMERSANEAKIRADIKAIEAAMEAYRADYGDYPPVDQNVRAGMTDQFPDPTPNNKTGTWDWDAGWTNCHYIYKALSGTNSELKQYMKFREKDIKRLSGNIFLILDPYGNPYAYRPKMGPLGTNTPPRNPGYFDLFSAGPNQKKEYPNVTNTDDVGNYN
jgi:prepilin-type N-terminal cleavage/methylation domain-containing protein